MITVGFVISSLPFGDDYIFIFFQLLGVSIRAGVPFALDFLPCFWKSLRGESLFIADLKEADYVLYKLTSDILSSTSPEELREILSFQGRAGVPSLAEEELDYTSSTGLSRKVFFTYVDLNGMVVELIPGGKELEVE